MAEIEWDNSLSIGVKLIDAYSLILCSWDGKTWRVEHETY
jgi:hypothetical protein